MGNKAHELAAKAFATALLSALAMLIVGYAEVRDAKSNRREILSLYGAIATITSFAQSTHSGIESYLAAGAAPTTPESVRIRELIAAIDRSRGLLQDAATRIAATGEHLSYDKDQPLNRVDLNGKVNLLRTRLYYTELKLSEQEIGTLTPKASIGELSLDVLARLGMAASADPVELARTLGWVAESRSGLDGQQAARLRKELESAVARMRFLDLLQYRSRGLWDSWLELRNDDQRVRTERMRAELESATESSIRALLDRLSENVDKSSDREIAGAKVAVKSLDISPTLKLAILGYPYWIALLFIMCAAALAAAKDGKTDPESASILSLRPGNWLEGPYRAVRLLSTVFPVVVGILVGVEAIPSIREGALACVYAVGMVLCGSFAVAVIVET